MNWSWLTLRVVIAATMLLLLFLSQRFWYRGLWRWSAKWGSRIMRVLLIVISLADSIRNGHGRLLPRGTFLNVLAGLWFFSALFAYFSVKIVHGFDRVWRFFRARKASPAATPLLP